MLVSIILSLILASPVLTVSVPYHYARGSGHSLCKVSGDVLPVPPGQTALVKPTIPPSFIGLGVGTQNYTCSSASTYTSAGAVAELFDISCLYGTPLFSSIQDVVMRAWAAAPPSITPIELINALAVFKSPIVLGQHYFIPNPITGVGLSPKWDFTSSVDFAGNPDAFVVGAKVGDIPAPTGPADVDWLSLKGIQGKLATQIFRIYTKGGQPPTSCTPGSPPITVKYTSQYWLYGSSA